VIPQVGERPGSALEMGAGNLHALRRWEKTHRACTALSHPRRASPWPRARAAGREEFMETLARLEKQ